MKRFFLVLLFALVIAPVNSFAAGAFTVERVAVDNNGHFTVLAPVNGGAKHVRYITANEHQDRMLASLLTAAVSGTTVDYSAVLFNGKWHIKRIVVWNQ